MFFYGLVKLLFELDFVCDKFLMVRNLFYYFFLICNEVYLIIIDCLWVIVEWLVGFYVKLNDY